MPDQIFLHEGLCILLSTTKMAASTFQKVERYFQKLYIPADQKMPLVLVVGEPPDVFYDSLPWIKRCETETQGNKYQFEEEVLSVKLIIYLKSRFKIALL